jgi:hypothetical protein
LILSQFKTNAMKTKNILIAFSALCCISVQSFAQNGASIQMKLSSSQGATGTFTTYFSAIGHRSEMLMSVPQMPAAMSTVTIVKKSNPDMAICIYENNKTYNEYAVKKEDNSKEKYTIQNLGDEKLMGYNCKHILVTSSSGSTTEIWNTKDIADFENYKDAYNGNSRTSLSSLETQLKEAGADGFPIKYIMKGKKDGDVTLEFVKMEKKTVADSMFEVPAGYSQVGRPAANGGQPNPASMSPEERAKYIEEMKAKYGK